MRINEFFINLKFLQDLQKNCLLWLKTNWNVGVVWQRCSKNYSSSIFVLITPKPPQCLMHSHPTHSRDFYELIFPFIDAILTSFQFSNNKKPYATKVRNNPTTTHTDPQINAFIFIVFKRFLFHNNFWFIYWIKYVLFNTTLLAFLRNRNDFIKKYVKQMMFTKLHLIQTQKKN